MEVKQNLSREGEPVLSYRISLPEVSENCGRLARYLEKTGEVWTAYWEKRVYPAACSELEERRAAARLFRPWTAVLTGEVTCQSGDLFSMKLEAAETHGDGRACRVCWGELWDLSGCAPVNVENLFNPRSGWKKRVLEQIIRAGEARLRENLWFPVENWREKARKYLSACEPWVDEKTVFWSFPQGFMADPADGTPIFGTEREEPQK